jgi:hypothetical protein
VETPGKTSGSGDLHTRTDREGSYRVKIAACVSAGAGPSQSELCKMGEWWV